MSSFLVLPLMEEWVNSVARIEEQSFSKPWSIKSIFEELENPRAVMLVALSQTGEIAGWAGFRFIFDEGSITNVAVAKNFRRRGIGRALVRGLGQRAEEMSLSTLVLEVRPSNKAAIALYEGLGFYRTGIRPGFYELPHEDAILMKLNLEEQPL